MRVVQGLWGLGAALVWCGRALNAPTALRCSVLRAVEELATRALRAPLRQPRRRMITNALRAARNPCAPRRPRIRAAPGPHRPGATSVWWGWVSSEALQDFECLGRRACRRYNATIAATERRGRRCPVVAISAARRGAQTPGRCAQRTSLSDSPRLFERSARRARSEFRGAPRQRAPQVRRRVQRPTAPL